MTQTANYKKTLTACYLGFITQAICGNFSPLLYLTFRRDYGLSFTQLGLISACFFFTQMVVDFLCAKVVDRIGYRKCIVTSEITSAAGLIGLAFLPDLMPDPYIGLLLCVFLYAVGSGLIEVLCSPIVEACPFENKAGVMSLLHSFYCWGCVGVILGSTLFFAVFGSRYWRILACLWALIPLYNIYNFSVCPIERLVEDGKGMSISSLLKTRIFWLLIVLMVCSGAAELSMAQWASSFVENALGVTKTVGDLAGPCLFAVFQGISRVIYGRYGERADLSVWMIVSGIGCLACYTLAGLSHDPIFGLIGCMLCGFCVGIMWPGSLNLSTKALPAGGTAMFALLALGGDLGGSIGPALVGSVSRFFGDDLHIGILSSIGFPLLLALGVIRLRRYRDPSRALKR